MSERTVLASFYSAADAKQAAEQIHALGIEVAQVDTLHAHPGVESDVDSFLISGDIPSLSAITLNTLGSRDANVLLAADPSASGMGDGQDNVTGRNYLLTVVSPESQVDEVVRVIKACGGYT
ncbi:MAG: hypothetical protein K6T83_00655 [Alicyclobacillus sp.]|nr:hypothetical protein [Alicyclobacillus sp.]